MPDSLHTLLHRLLTATLYASIVITPFLFTFSNVELFEFNKMLFIYATTLLTTGLWIARMIVEQRWIVRRTPLDIPLALFLAAQLAATLLSLDVRTSLLGYYTRFHGGLLSWICYALLYWAAVSNLRWRELRGMLVAAVVALFGSSLYAFPEHFGASPSCLLLRGSFDTSCWVQDVQHRVFGTFGQPNWLAAFIVLILPLAGVGAVWKFVLDSKNKLTSWWDWRYLSLATVVLGWTVLLFTKSRSGLLAAVVGGGVTGLGILYIWKLASENISSNIEDSLHSPWSWIAISGIIFSTALFGTPWTPAVSDLLQTQRPAAQQEQPASTPVNRLETGGTDSGEIRTIVWRGALDVWLRYPFFGSGPSTFAYSYYLDRPIEHNDVSEWDFLYNKAHNEFLDFLATTGVVGLGTYLLLLGWFSWICLEIIWNRDEQYALEEQLVALALLAGNTALSVSNFFGFSTVAPTTVQLLFMAVVAGLHHEKNHSSKKSSSTRTPAEIGGEHYFALAIAALFVLFGWAQVWRWWLADRYAATAQSMVRQNQIYAGVETYREALELMPHEPFLYESLGQAYARLAVGLDQVGEATAAAEITDAAVLSSDEALRRNPYHLNFYRSQIRLYLWLAELDEAYLDRALEVADAAQELAPTDPKLVYMEGLILRQQGENDAALEQFEQAIEMRPAYTEARGEAAELYIEAGRPNAAADQYEYVLQFIDADNTMALQGLDALAATTSAEIEKPGL